MGVISQFRMPLIAAGLGSLALASTASAEYSEVMLQITAQSSLGTATWTHRYDPLYLDPPFVGRDYNFFQAEPIEFRNTQGELIFRLQNAEVICHEDPDVAVAFNLLGGAVNTTFTVTSALLGFGAIANSEGRDSASMNVLDNDGDGASLTPVDGPMYRTFYNGAVAGIGTTFQDLHTLPIVALPDSPASRSEAFPGGGAYVPIAGAVSSMSAQFRFSLSANDIGGGTSIYRIQEIPAPAAFSLLGLGGLMATRRRRSN